MGDHMVETVARAMFAQDHDEAWHSGEGRTKLIYINNARAALSACHHEELVEALKYLSNEAAGWRDADLAEVGGWTNTRCLMLRIEQARAVLAKVEASDA